VKAGSATSVTLGLLEVERVDPYGRPGAPTG
jgi:hypothetical protein